MYIYVYIYIYIYKLKITTSYETSTDCCKQNKQKGVKKYKQPE